MPRKVIHLQRHLDRKPRMIAARFVDFGDVFAKVTQQHSPVIKVISRHGAVFGKSNLPQPDLHGLSGIFRRLAHRVVAERSVHVIIGRQWHSQRVRHASLATARSFPSMIRCTSERVQDWGGDGLVPAFCQWHGVLRGRAVPAPCSLT